MSSTEDMGMKHGGSDENHAHCHHHHDHHSHDHGHSHGHSHHHTHEHGTETAGSMTAHLLKYMLDHNTHHVDELRDLIAKLTDEGCTGAAQAATRALEFYQQGNHELAHAVEHLSTDGDSSEHADHA